MVHRRLSPHVIWLAALILLAGCQSVNPPGPTLIPTSTTTLSPTPSQTLSVSLTPIPSLRPLVTATPAVPEVPQVVDAPTAVPTLGPFCYEAKAGDTLMNFASRAGYNDPSIIGPMRELNGLCPTCNNIQVGQTYCVPRQTATPTPPGHEATETEVFKALGNISQGAILPYKVIKDDNIISIQVKTGNTLRQLCPLNSPEHINCGPCNLDQPYSPGCRPLLREGDTIRYYGPTPTPTITPTITGSETATPTPSHGIPELLAPVHEGNVAGIVQLRWMPIAGLLQPDEYYFVQVSDITTGQTRDFDTQATSLRLPADMIPTGDPHTINWRVGVIRKAPDGTSVQISPTMSLIYTFIWQGK